MLNNKYNSHNVAIIAADITFQDESRTEDVKEGIWIHTEGDSAADTVYEGKFCYGSIVLQKIILLITPELSWLYTEHNPTGLLTEHNPTVLLTDSHNSCGW